MRFKPRNYQTVATEFIIDHERCNFWGDMGCGKTAATLSAIDALLEFGDIDKVLIVAPLRVATTTWPAEFKKWTNFLHIEHTVLAGLSLRDRLTAVKSKAPVHIINYDNLPWLFETLGSQWNYDMVVLDESDKAKAHDSVRFKGKPDRKKRDENGKIIKTKGHPGLKWARDYVKRWLNLAGTPAPNGAEDLWTQTYLLDKELLGNTWTKFHERYFDKHPYIDHVWKIKPSGFQSIMKALEPISLTISPKDFTDLPPLVESIVTVPLSDKDMARYRKLESKFILTLTEGGEKMIPQALNLSGALLQFTSGFLYREDGTYGIEHHAKLDALVEMVESLNGQPVLIAHHFQAEREQILAKIPNARVLDKDPATVDAWNRGEIPVLVVHPASAGHGLNLQHGGNQMIFFSVDWNLGNYLQVIERIGPMRQYQAGLDRPCFVHYLIAPGTVDEIVLQRLQTKAEVQDVLKSAMKISL